MPIKIKINKPIKEAKGVYAKKLKAYDDVLKELSFQIATFLLKTQTTPNYGKTASKAIMGLLRQAINTANAMSVEEMKVMVEDYLIYPDEDPEEETEVEVEIPIDMMFDDGGGMTKKNSKRKKNSQTESEKKRYLENPMTT